MRNELSFGLVDEIVAYGSRGGIFTETFFIEPPVEVLLRIWSGEFNIGKFDQYHAGSDISFTGESCIAFYSCGAHEGTGKSVVYGKRLYGVVK